MKLADHLHKLTNIMFLYLCSVENKRNFSISLGYVFAMPVGRLGEWPGYPLGFSFSPLSTFYLLFYHFEYFGFHLSLYTISLLTRLSF